LGPPQAREESRGWSREAVHFQTGGKKSKEKKRTEPERKGMVPGRPQILFVRVGGKIRKIRGGVGLRNWGENGTTFTGRTLRCLVWGQPRKKCTGAKKQKSGKKSAHRQKKKPRPSQREETAGVGEPKGKGEPQGKSDGDSNNWEKS